MLVGSGILRTSFVRAYMRLSQIYYHVLFVVAICVQIPGLLVRVLRRRFLGPTRHGWTWGLELTVTALRGFLKSESKNSFAEANIASFCKHLSVPNLFKDIRIVPVDIEGVPAEWIFLREAMPASTTIMYLHGGGYWYLNPQTTRVLTIALARYKSVRILAVDYRLAPAFKFPSPVEDVVAVYKWLVSSNGLCLNPKTLVILGESAGGGLAVATPFALKSAGLPMPACVVAISPWVSCDAIHLPRVC